MVHRGGSLVLELFYGRDASACFVAWGFCKGFRNEKGNQHNIANIFCINRPSQTIRYLQLLDLMETLAKLSQRLLKKPQECVLKKVWLRASLSDNHVFELEWKLFGNDQLHNLHVFDWQNTGEISVCEISTWQTYYALINGEKPIGFIYIPSSWELVHRQKPNVLNFPNIVANSRSESSRNCLMAGTAWQRAQKLLSCRRTWEYMVSFISEAL